MEDIKTLIHGDAKNHQIEAIDQLAYKLYGLEPTCPELGRREEVVIVEAK